jgi:hypothetical protein
VQTEHRRGFRCPGAHRLVERGHGGGNAVKQPVEHGRVDAICRQSFRRGAVVGVGVPPAQRGAGEDVAGTAAYPCGGSGVLGQYADGPGKRPRPRGWWCGRAGVGLGEGGLGVGKSQAIAGADAELGRVSGEIGCGRVRAAAGVDEYRVGFVVMVGDGDVRYASTGGASQGRRSGADSRRAAPVMGQIETAQPHGQIC